MINQSDLNQIIVNALLNEFQECHQFHEQIGVD